MLELESNLAGYKVGRTKCPIGNHKYPVLFLSVFFCFA
jgi:hypothetical protein